MTRENSCRRDSYRRRNHLASLVWAHSHITVRAACEAGVHACAECRLAFFAVLAPAICYIEGEDDTVAFLKEGNAAADFGDDTHVLMA